MLVIRLRRIGRKHDPHYRIVIAEHTAPAQGKFIAEVGHYHPKSKALHINQENFLSWVNRGAKPSNTVAKLANKIKISHKNIIVKEYHSKPKAKEEQTPDRTAESTQPTSELPTEEHTSEHEEEGKTESASSPEAIAEA